MTTDTAEGAGKRVEDGGPAFPLPAESNPYGDPQMVHSHGYGMSLRDYFAAAAMPAMIGQFGQINENTMQLASGDAYKYADAMLRARSEGGK